MGASVAPQIARPSTMGRAPPAARPRMAVPQVAGVPTFLSVVQRRESAGGNVASRIADARQREQTEDRDEAERLAERIGQHEVRDAMRADDARQAERSGAAQASRAATRSGTHAPAMRSAASPAPATGFGQEPAPLVLRTEPPVLRSEPELQTRADDGGGDAPADAGAPAAGGSGDGAAAGRGAGGAGDAGAAAGGDAGAAGAAAGSGAAGAAGGSAGAAASGRPGGKGGRGARGAHGGPLTADPPRRDTAPPPETHAGEIETGDLVLIDIELAEHQRWAGALGRVGEVASIQRAEFIVESVGSGFIEGVASGASMGLAIGLVSRAVPVLGPIIGGGMALHGLLTRDWDATASTIGKFGEGGDTYEVLANSLASVSAVIDVVSQILGVINGIVGVVQAVAIGVAAGAGVLAFFTFGATAGIAIAAGELAVTCEEISAAINVVTMVLDGVNSALLNPCITLFRALHSFTTQADPREVEAGGRDLSSAAAASGAALGSWVGGKAAHIGARPPPPADDGAPTRPLPPRESPPAASGDGPEVHFEQPPAGGAQGHAAPEGPARPSLEEIVAAPGRRITDDQAPDQPATAEAGAPPRAAEPEQLAFGFMNEPAPVAPQPPRTGGELHAPTKPLALRSYGSADPVPQRLQPGSIGTYDLVVRNPHPAALESNPRSPTNRRAAGRMPSRGREAAGVYLEHQSPAAVMHEVLPHHEYHGPKGPELQNRGGRDTREALVIAFPEAVKPFKDPMDAALLSEVRARKAQGEAVAPAELIARGARHSQESIAQAGANVPPQQVSKTFLAEMETLHGERYGYEPLRPGVPHPPGSPLQGLSGPEIDAHLDRMFAPHEFPIARRGEQMEMFPGAPRPAKPLATEPEQLSFPGYDRPSNPDQLSLNLAPPPTGPQVTPPPARTSPDVPMRVGEGSTRGSEPLTTAQYQEKVEMAVEMGMPRDQIHQVESDTRYGAAFDRLLIGPDVNPLPLPQRPTGLENPANAALESRAVIGHEVIGHREAAIGGQTREEGWHEELQASARAALHTPGLSREQSWLLLQDAAARRRFQQREGEIFIDVERYGPGAPQPEAPRGGGRADTGGEPSVVVDWNALGLPPPPANAGQARVAPVAPEPQPSAATRTPPAITGNWATAAREARTATTGAPVGGPQPGPGEPTLGTRAHQVGALFLPQLFGGGGEAPTYAQQQAAHRGMFTADNQPAEGVERINPHYTPPPATPAEIVAIQNQILNMLAVRARAEREAEHQGDRVQSLQANRAPIAGTMADTRRGLTAVAAHQAAVARRDAANQDQQRRQQEAAGLVAGYPSRATGLAALSVPLAAWEGFTSIASELPGDAGDKMAQMNKEAQEMQAAFDKMGARMLGVDTEQPARQGELLSDGRRLDATGEQAQTSDQRLHTADEGATGLRDANEATLAEARRRRDAATARGASLQDAADERQQHVASLAAQLSAWAVQHRNERAIAIEATARRLEGEGKIVTQRPPEQEQGQA